MSRFAGGAEMSLVHGDLSLTFDKARRAYSFTCYGDDVKGVRLTLEPFELEQIVGEFLAVREMVEESGRPIIRLPAVWPRDTRPRVPK